MDVPDPQTMEDFPKAVEITPREHISERILLVHRLQEENVEVIQRSVEGIISQEHISARPQVVDATVPQIMEELQERISQRKHEQVVDAPVPMTVHQPGSVLVEFPQSQYIDKVVDMLVVMQRQVLRIQTVLKTVESSPTQFVGRVVWALVIMQMCHRLMSRSRSASQSVCTNRSLMCQCLMSRSRSASRSVCTNRSLMCQCLMSRSRSASRSAYTNRLSINQVTKIAEIPQILFIDKVVDMLVVRQRQVPRIQMVLMTMVGPPTQFVGRVMEALMACVRWHAQNAAASQRSPKTTHAMNVASTATSENVPHASVMRAQDARRLHWRTSFHGKLDVDVGEVAIGGDFIPITSFF